MVDVAYHQTDGRKMSKRSTRRVRVVAQPATETAVQRDPTEPELLNAIRSLCTDQLLPYGRIIRKRLAELAEADGFEVPDVDVARLRRLCEDCNQLKVNQEGEADWSAVVIGMQTSFVDIYDSKDDYSAEFWAAAATYFDSLSADEMNFPGGRYVCAQFLVSKAPEFLDRLTLGKVCHVVQIAMTQRKLLGYLNGAIVPYGRSQTAVKEQCAEQQKLCRKNKMPLATWETLRTCLYEMLEVTRDSDVGGLPLSNVKRVLRARFRIDLSETALGHATVCDLFKDERMRDLCAVKLLDNGYVVIPAFESPAAKAASEYHGLPMPYYLNGADPYWHGLQIPPLPPAPILPGLFPPYDALAAPVGFQMPNPFHPMAPYSHADFGAFGQPCSGAAWDMTCNVLGMSRNGAVANHALPYGGLVPSSPTKPKARDGTEQSPSVLLGTSAPYDAPGAYSPASAPTTATPATITTPERSHVNLCSDGEYSPKRVSPFNMDCSGSTDVGSEPSCSVPPTPGYMVGPTPSPHGRGQGGQSFAAMLDAAAESAESDGEEQPVCGLGMIDLAMADTVEIQQHQQQNSKPQPPVTPHSIPPTPFVNFAATPSPYVHCPSKDDAGLGGGGAFFSDLLRAAVEDDDGPSSSSASPEVSPKNRGVYSIPATPAIFAPATPSPFLPPHPGSHPKCFSHMLKAAIDEHPSEDKSELYVDPAWCQDMSDKLPAR